MLCLRFAFMSSVIDPFNWRNNQCTRLDGRLSKCAWLLSGTASGVTGTLPVWLGRQNQRGVRKAHKRGPDVDFTKLFTGKRVFVKFMSVIYFTGFQYESTFCQVVGLLQTFVSEPYNTSKAVCFLKKHIFNIRYGCIFRSTVDLPGKHTFMICEGRGWY